MNCFYSFVQKCICASYSSFISYLTFRMNIYVWVAIEDDQVSVWEEDLAQKETVLVLSSPVRRRGPESLFPTECGFAFQLLTPQNPNCKGLDLIGWRRHISSGSKVGKVAKTGKIQKEKGNRRLSSEQHCCSSL